MLEYIAIPRCGLYACITVVLDGGRIRFFEVFSPTTESYISEAALEAFCDKAVEVMLTAMHAQGITDEQALAGVGLMQDSLNSIH